MDKILIKNVKLLDGVNYFGEPYSLIVCGGEIAEICDEPLLSENNFNKIIDGENCFLTPTFVDVHSHSDISVLSPFELASKKLSGFGAEIVGNCGLSCFPVSCKNIDNLKKIYKKYPIEINWETFADYQKIVQQNLTKTEIYSLVGHNTLHSAVATYENRAVSVDEIKLMQNLLAQSLEAGALGLSLGLLYSPGRFAEPQEVIELFKTVAEYEKTVCVHLKSEGDYLLESLMEMLDFSRQANLHNLHISHLKTGGEANFYKIDSLMEIIEKAPQTHGVYVTFDRYPFCQSLTQLSVAGPEKFLSVPDSRIMEILQNSDIECQNFLDYLKRKEETYFNKITLVATELVDYKKFAGENLVNIALKTNQSVENLILTLVKYDSINALAAFESMSEVNMRRIISHPLCMLGSDETARPLDFSLGSSHVRNFGSVSEFIKILCQLDCDKSFIIKKLSSLPCQRFSLHRLGELKKKYKAKFNLIDFDKIKTNADFANPHQVSDGVKILHFE